MSKWRRTHWRSSNNSECRKWEQDDKEKKTEHTTYNIKGYTRDNLWLEKQNKYQLK